LFQKWMAEGIGVGGGGKGRDEGKSQNDAHKGEVISYATSKIRPKELHEIEGVIWEVR